MAASRSCVLLLAIVLAATADISPSTTPDATNTEKSSTDEAEHSGVSKTDLTNKDDLIGADSDGRVLSAPKFYNLTGPLKHGATVKDMAKLVSAAGGEDGTAIVRRKRTHFKKCHKCGGGGGGGGYGGGGYGGFAIPSPIIIQVVKQPKGGGCYGGGCGGGGYQQSPCGHGGCGGGNYYPPPRPRPVYHPQPQQRPAEYCDPCQRAHGGGGHPGGGGGYPGGGSGSYSQSSSSSHSESYSGSWGKK